MLSRANSASIQLLKDRTSKLGMWQEVEGRLGDLVCEGGRPVLNS